MKYTILTFLLLSTLTGFGQSKSLDGSIYNTEPAYDLISKDSVYYSLVFRQSYAVLKVKYKKLARVEIIDTLAYPFVSKKDIREMKENESSAWMDNIVDDHFLFVHYSHNQVDSILRITGIFYKKTENTLNETVWISFSPKEGAYPEFQQKLSYELHFKEDKVKMFAQSDKKRTQVFVSGYKLNGDQIKVSDIPNLLRILPGRNIIEFKEATGIKVLYKKKQ